MDTFIHNETKYIRNAFHIFKRKGDTVKVGETIKFKSFRMGNNPKSVVKIYYSNYDNPLIMDDGASLGDCNIYWHTYDDTKEVINKITFGECIDIVSYPIYNSLKKVHLKIDYEWK